MECKFMRWCNFMTRHTWVLFNNRSMQKRIKFFIWVPIQEVTTLPN